MIGIDDVGENFRNRVAGKCNVAVCGFRDVERQAEHLENMENANG